MGSKFFYLAMRGLGLFIKSFRQNLLSIIAFATLIFVYHAFYVTATGAAEFLNRIGVVTSVRVYLESDKNAAPTYLLEKARSIKGVTAAKYFSQKEAKSFVMENAPNIGSAKSFSEEFFPAFIELTPNEKGNEDLLTYIEAQASKLPGVQSVSYGKEYMSKFMSVRGGAKVFLTTLSVLFALSCVFVIYDTITLSLYGSREEIKLYSLAGATRPFISTPYVVSALLEGIFSYGAATAVFYASFSFFNGKVLFPAGINAFYMPGLSYFAAAFIFICFASAFSAMAGVISFLRKVSSVNEN